MVMFCPHIPANIVKTGIGNLRHMEIYCNKSKNVETKQPMKSTAIYEYPKEAKLHGIIQAEREAFESLIKDSGVTFEDFVKSVHNTASEDKLLEYANLSVLLICDAGVPISDLPKLFNASMKLGFALGITTEAAIRALAIGVGRQSRLVLDNIGIIFKAEDAYDWFKKTYPNETFDRINAWKRYAIKKVVEKSAEINITAKDIERLQRTQSHIKTARKQIGKEAIKANRG